MSIAGCYIGTPFSCKLVIPYLKISTCNFHNGFAEAATTEHSSPVYIVIVPTLLVISLTIPN